MAKHKDTLSALDRIERLRDSHRALHSQLTNLLTMAEAAPDQIKLGPTEAKLRQAVTDAEEAMDIFAGRK